MGSDSILFRATAPVLARLLGVHEETVRRWRAAARMPAAHELRARLALDGELERLSTTEKGWRLVRRVLETLNGWCYTPGGLVAYPFRLQQLRELARVVTRLTHPTVSDDERRELELAVEAARSRLAETAATLDALLARSRGQPVPSPRLRVLAATIARP